MSRRSHAVHPHHPRRTATLLLAALLATLPACGAVATSASALPPSVAASAAASTRAAASTGLDDPQKKEIAMQLVSSAENSSLDWRAQYRYIEDINDRRGYTAGIIGFCTGTGDLLDLVQAYTDTEPDNVLAKYLPALRQVNGTESHEGLDPGFTTDWATAADDPAFQRAQDAERDRVYFDPAIRQAKQDGLGTLGQFAYYDAAVMHGPDGLVAIRNEALAQAQPPTQGGSETEYLNAFLLARRAEMRKEPAHSDTSRVDTAQQLFLDTGNLDLTTPLTWKVYGQSYTITG
ncbi:chitosanase CsnA [Kitasatospora nipponensis]|uniref:Chitosanase n=1 Tax=Kitasatospora nipponensis TaxID=258049 RepID=A0ABP4GQX4_9ACTN